MKPSSPSTSPLARQEFAVRRETFNHFFDSPLAKSTFHDLVNKGIVIPVKALKGFFLLNKSLKRLGLPEVDRIPTPKSKRSLEQIGQLALSLIDPSIFQPPTWTLLEEPDKLELNQALLMVELHRGNFELIETVQEKLAYGGGVLDAQAILDSDAAGTLPKLIAE